MRLHTIARGPEGAPLVLLLHGLFGSAGNLGVLQRGLAAAAHVVALDLRNHGASPHASGMSYAAMAEDVLETLDGLGASGPVAWLGHSMGGKVAMTAALAYPARVARLLVADIAPIPYPPHFRAYAEAMRRLTLSPGLTRLAADAALADSVPEQAVRQFLLQNLLPGAAPRWRIGLDAIASGLPEIESWTNSAAPYSGPALFLRGARSDYVPQAAEGAIRAWFPSARIETVPDAGHWLHAENPADVLAAARGFLLPN